MKTTPLEPARWSGRRWLCALGLAFAVQAALIVYFGERPVPLTPVPKLQPEINLAADAWAESQMAELPGLSDPLLFALPHPKSFSGKAWFTFHPAEYEMPSWTEPPRWLNLPTNELGQPFATLLPTNAARPLLVSDTPLPALAGFGPLLPQQPMRTQSTVRLRGGLANRTLLEAQALPSWEHNDILTNSIVQLVLAADGLPLSMTLLNSCGLKKADELALKTVSQLSFNPLPPSAPKNAGPAIGQVIFEWHTIARTNPTTAALP